MAKDKTKDKAKGKKELRMYCGAGSVPRGMVRATPEYCVQRNQIRYYGIVAIDPSILKTAKGKTSDLNKEKLKLLKLRDLAKILLNEGNKIKITLNDDTARPSKIKQAQKK